MNTMRFSLPVVLAAAALCGTFAGGPGKKCTMDTQTCLDQMTRQMKSTGWIGIEYDNSSGGPLTVTKVVPGSPAEQAGLEAGDVLTAANGLPISASNAEALQQAKAAWTPGKTVALTVRRGTAERVVSVKLAPMPADVLARYIGEHMLEHAAAAGQK